MKILFYLLIISATVLIACSKNEASTFTGQWRLTQELRLFLANRYMIVPTADSTVTLFLNRDKTYGTQLGGKTISHSTYSVVSNNSSYYQVLQLNNFNQTGIFDSFTISLIGADGQIASQVNGFQLHVSNDTLTLSSDLTPGGATFYTFVRN